MGGVRRGIERAVTAMMPGIILILVVLIGYSIADGRFAEGFGFLFKPDFTKLSANGVIVALGHAFFTLSLASGVIIAYGAYVPRGISIARTGIIIGIADTAVALMAGLAIFPLVFEYDLAPSGGPGLIFVTLPIAFGEMPLGAFFGTLFFVMLFLAAFTSAISLLEPTIALLMERFSLTRFRAVTAAGIVLWVCSLPTVFSFNLWADVHPIKSGVFASKNIFDLIDYLTANILLPLGGLMTALFAGWVMARAATREEFGDADGSLHTAWRFTLRYIAPVAIVIVFLSSIGVLDPLLEMLGLVESASN
jgi:NSS family neurotransmitter:Na+ symporter